MSIDVSWYDQKSNIVLWKIGETWTIDDYDQACKQTEVQLLSSDQPAAMIIDATAPIERPRMGLMSRLLKALSGGELEILVYVREKNDPPLVPQLLNLLMRTNRSIKIKQLKFMSSVQDAAAYILDTLSA